MGKPRSALRLLLIQVRDHPAAIAQEQGCVLDRCRIAPGQLATYNVVERPAIRYRDLPSADAVILGGAGAHSVTEEYEFTAPLTEVVLELLAEERPFFGSCWGHQFLGRILGGTVVTDEAAKEVGTYDARLTEPGRHDPLTAGLPESFAIQLGHKDRIDVAPPGLVTLASTARCRHQLVRVAGKPAYGSQFHSEMSEADMRARVRVYRDYLEGGDEAVTAFDAQLRPSPEADRLLDRFLDLYT